MADVFLSYSRQDLRRANPVIKALEAAGLTVWWDRRLVGGSEFSKEIRDELEAAGAVVALWSSRSVNSPWVLDEAGRGRDSQRLVPAILDGTPPPLGFGQIHTIDLSRRHRVALDELVAAVKAKIGRGKVEASHRPGPRFAIPRRPAIAGLALLLVGVAAAVYLFALPGSRSGRFRGGTVAVYRFEALTDDPQTKLAARLASDSVERIFATNLIDTVAQGSAPRDALAGADLGLRGSVERTGGDLRISANVIDPRSGRTLWSNEVSRSAAESRQLADAFATLTADVLRCSIYTKRHIPNYDSAELLSRILRYCEAGDNFFAEQDQLPKLAQQLVEVAPNSAQAHADYATELATFYDPITNRSDLLAIDAEIKKALALDPNNGVVRWAMAKVADPGVSLAAREHYLRDGLRLDPDYPWNHSLLGRLMVKVGRINDGRTQFEQFVGDYPLDYNQRGFYGYLLAESGDINGARAQFEIIRNQVPDRTSWATAYEWQAELLYGDLDRAIRAWDSGKHRAATANCAAFVFDARKRHLVPSADAIEQHCGQVPELDEKMQALFGHIGEALSALDRNLPVTAPPGPFAPDWVFERGFEGLRQDARLLAILAHAGIPQYWLQTGNFPDFCGRERLPYDCRQAAQQAVANLRSRNGRRYAFQPTATQ
jgi:TolB-like protein/tetratricopeptide (TPR) repeat protein